MDRTVSEFNKTLFALLRMFELKVRSEMDKANIDRLSKELSLLLSVGDRTEVIKHSFAYFEKFSNEILGREESFFTTMDVKKQMEEEGVKITNKNDYLIKLSVAAQKSYISATKVEKDKIYEAIRNLFTLCMEYHAL